MRSAGVGLVCDEGVGVLLRFSLSRCSSLCHLVINAAFVSPCSLRCHSPPRLARRRPRPMPHVLRANSLRSFLSPCSCVVSYRFSPRSFDELGGAFFACLPLSLRLSFRRLVFLTRFARPRACLLRGGSSSPVPISCGRRSRPALRLRLCSCLPVLRQAWAGSVAARSLLACLCSRHAGGWIASSGLVYLLGSASAAGCVRFVVSWFVYINGVFARV